MKSLIPIVLIILLSFHSIYTLAQTTDSSSLDKITTNFSERKNTLELKSLLIPAVMISYGVTTMSNHGSNSINQKIKDRIWENNPHKQFHLDNYLQFGPVVSVYGLNLIGIKGKNNFRDITMLYLMSNIILNATVYPIKKITHQLRPDSSAYSAFPSGHTGEAFATAELMRMEYKNVSPWYGVAGYTMAIATGYLRMYNNKHWLSDVVAGAGIGILSTKLAYWLYPKIQHILFKDKFSKTIVFPAYQNKSFGFVITHKFE